MTIVATEDSRNGEWKNGNKGASLLKKMGWTEGQGLGRDQQGTSVALRAVKRSEETLGIGASSADTHGSSGWSETSDSFASVLSNLQQQHKNDSSGSEYDETKKSKKKTKKLILARNKVTAGHAQKMREAKCLKNKSAEDMAAIFGSKHVPKEESNKKKKEKEEIKRP